MDPVVFATVAAASFATSAIALTHPAQAGAALAALKSVINCATSTACVGGNNTAGGPGVSGTSKNGSGIVASGATGVKGSSTSGFGVWGISTSTNSQAAPAGVYGFMPHGTGVAGSSGNGTGDVGVSGATLNGTGVLGFANSNGNGVSGEALGSGTGVTGSGETV